jgi:hypothetical protein
MIAWLIKHRIWIVAVAVIIISLMTQPLVGKGNNGNWIVPCATAIGASFIYTLLSKELLFHEKWILPIIFAMISLVITAMAYQDLIEAVNLYDEDYDYVKNNFLVNVIFYAPSAYGAILCIEIYQRYYMRQR